MIFGAKIMKRCISVICVLALLCCVFVACGKERPVEEEQVSIEKDGIQIGISIDSLVIERWEKDRDIFVSKAMELGAEVNVQNANGDINKQREQMQRFIDSNVDIIVVIAVDSGSLGDMVSKAHAKGIKVVAYDRLLRNADVDLYISFDNREVGRLMAEAILEECGAGANVIMINGSVADNNVSEVDSGFYEVARDQLNIIDVTYIDGWKQELAYDYVESHRELFDDVDALMCGNDAIAGQAINALSVYRMADDITVVGQDAELEACQRIVGDMQYMTVYKPIDVLAETAATYAVQVVKGEKLDYTGKIYDGSFYVPYVALKPYAVTKSNMDAMVIDSGFHLKDDVYLNVN